MQLREYLAEVARAVEVILRPQRGLLHARWLGIDTEPRTFRLLRNENGFTAQLEGAWLGSHVVEQWGHAAGTRIRSTMRGLDTSPHSRAQCAVGIKRITGECNCSIALDQVWGTTITLESAASTLLVVGPEVVQGLTDAQFAALNRSGYDGPEPKYGIPEWAIGIVSNLEPGDELRGFDPDPLITAHGLAEAVLSFAGQRRRDEPERYSVAAAELRWAVSTLSVDNERVLQQLVERKPWILVHESEFSGFLPQFRIGLTERLENGSDRSFSAIPDFIYHQADGVSLVVEIEAATKRIFVRTTQASFQVGAAPALHSMFQIAGYRRLLSGPLGAQARRALGKADSWSFRFLLVVGSRLQPQFDQRSWAAFRDTHYEAGIEVRTWDHYIDRLERIARAAKMDSV